MATFGSTPWSNPQMGWGYSSGPTPQANRYLDYYAQQPQRNPYSPGSVDPTKAIQSSLPGIEEQMNKNFASAASRLGRPATQRSSPYQTAFGREARGASNDIAALTQQNLLNASMFNQNQAQDWATTQYNAGANAASQTSAQGYGAGQQRQQAQQDWWQRYYDWYLRGGSPENLNYWQSAGMPLANNYMQQFSTPWAG